MPGTVFFDLETRRSRTDVGGMGNMGQMGISVGVSYSTETGQFHIFQQEESEELAQQLIKADLVVGFNHLHFDYGVLQSQVLVDLVSQTVNLDLLVELEKVLGHRVKLDSVAGATLGVGKSADGLEALRWWQQHKKTGDIQPLLDIARYCCQDVKVTREVYEYGREHGRVKYFDRRGQVQEVEVSW